MTAPTNGSLISFDRATLGYGRRAVLTDRTVHSGRCCARDVVQLLQRLPGCSRKADESADHQVGHIVGVALRVNSIQIPGPFAAIMLEITTIPISDSMPSQAVAARAPAMRPAE